jgi:hypothetical protein
MPRLVTGEFNDRMAAERVIENLVRAGIPREQIYIETELPPDELRGRKGGEVAAAEVERRIAGLETGTLIGGIMGVFGGLILAVMNYVLALSTSGGQSFGWPLNSVFWSAIAGAVVGLLIGAAMGATIDLTLTRLGAGPARPREECLVTVRADNDEKLTAVRSVFFDHRARHVLGAELAA